MICSRPCKKSSAGRLILPSSPLNIACVFSPPAELTENEDAKKEIKQLASDLLREKD